MEKIAKTIIIRSILVALWIICMGINYGKRLDLYIALGTFWLVCAILNYGITLAYYDNEYPWDNNKPVAYLFGGLFSFCSPIMLLVLLPMSGWVKHGLKFRKIK